MPKISVIVPIYRAEKYIERCVVSLFDQTLDDIEYIFVDDCSPDSSYSLLSNLIDYYPHKKSKIKLLRNDKNLGVLRTRRRGITESTGDYVIHCDADDWVEKRMYEDLYKECISKNADIVWCDFWKVERTKYYLIQQKGNNGPIKDLLLSKRQGSLWNHLVKRDIVQNSKIVYPTQNMAEDMVLLLQYFALAKSHSYINTPYYYYFQNENSVSSGENKEKIVLQAYQMAENLNAFNSFCEQIGLNNKWIEELTYRKFFNKRWLLPAVDSVKNCNLWINCHKDINYTLFKDSYISKNEKIISFLVELRLYPFLRKIIRGR